jgi:hypothetical protein
MTRVGTWRSLVAHTLGVRGVGGSNPLVPTTLQTASHCSQMEKNKSISEYIKMLYYSLLKTST